MKSTSDRAARFIASFEYELELVFWTSIRLRECGELVYRHGVIFCSCGRNQSEAYTAWKRENSLG